MITQPPATRWQENGWNGVSFNHPDTWIPTVIYPSYLLFEENGHAVFEIKWQNIRGTFSSSKNFSQIQKTLKKGVRLVPWKIPDYFQKGLERFIVSGFQIIDSSNSSNGILIYCSKCKRASLVQWYLDEEKQEKLIRHVLASFCDHPTGNHQNWSVYDIRVQLPVEAILKSHEFVPGRYTLSFEIKGTTVTLYRFKPAALLLQNKTLGEFGSTLFGIAPVEENDEDACWLNSPRGFRKILTQLQRKPAWQRMKLWHDNDQNVILGVKAEGNPLTETEPLNSICKSYRATESV